MTTDSDFAIPPGSLLAEELEERGLSRRELAAMTGLSPRTIGDLIRGKRTCTAEIALVLERAIEVKAYLWLRLEADYRLALARRAMVQRTA